MSYQTLIITTEGVVIALLLVRVWSLRNSIRFYKDQLKTAWKAYHAK